MCKGRVSEENIYCTSQTFRFSLYVKFSDSKIKMEENISFTLNYSTRLPRCVKLKQV